MSGLSESERRSAEDVLGPSCVCHCSAVARLYTAYPGSSQWNYANMGAMIICSDRTYNNYFLRMVDLQSMQVVFEQEFYNNFLYSNPRPYFHAFETDSEVAGISFADQQEAQRFLTSVMTCKSKSPTNGGYSVNSYQNSPTSNSNNTVYAPVNFNSPPTGRVNPENVPDLYETPKQRKKRERQEKEANRIERIKERRERERNKRTGRPLNIEGPTNILHVSHIGWDNGSGFQIRNIPAEWKQLFKDAGVKKKDLKDPKTAAFIYNTVQSAMSGGARAPPPPPQQPRPPPPPSERPLSPSPQSRAPPPPPSERPLSPPPVIRANLSKSMGSPPPQVRQTFGAPPPPIQKRPSVPGLSQSFAAPPKAKSSFMRTSIEDQGGYDQSYTDQSYADQSYDDQSYDNNYDQSYDDNYDDGTPPPPPPPPTSGLASALKGVQLKKADTSYDLNPPPESGGGGSLLATLSSAMAQRRIDIKEDDTQNDNDDWSDEEWE